ncbi:unnamed protein product [Rotaria sordida]|uniref:Nucleolar protein 6 n=1 Tax=Rotaria sordida TaxID=392033 RepID=A0A813UTD0_9BILA|nr:unnamed protein product [Rotaria sordida]CAF0891363.1 unnamed protein product [Rotaria sordida]
MDNNHILSSFDQYHADILSMIDSYITSTDNISTSISTSPENQKYPCRRLLSNSLSSSSSSSLPLITFDRDPALSEHLTDEIRWLLIQYGPHQPRNDKDLFLPSAKPTNNGRGTICFREKWFDDVRFSDWLEYSLSTCRAYCFYCRLFSYSNRNRAFSRDGIKNWRKCLGSRGQKKRRSIGTLLKSTNDIIVCQRRGLFESHAMSESHKQAYKKYLVFIDQMHLERQINNDRKQDDDTNLVQNIKQNILYNNNMEIFKRKANGISSTNGYEQKKTKKKKTINNKEQDLEITYFESEITYHSTVTKMKVNALLNEVTLKESQRSEIDQFIEEISNELKSIPQGKIRHLSKMSEWLEKFDIKIPLSFSKMKKKFQFIPPTIIQIIGSYTYDGIIVKSSNKISTIIDLLIEIPRICIHKKDYLNNEYIEKRAIYLCYMAKKLKYSLEFTHLNDTTLNQAVLLVKPNEKSSFAIRILLAPEQDYFNEKRLLPTSSNLRWKWFNDTNEDEIETYYSTPNYNSSILFDCRYRSTSDYLNELFLSSNELCNGLKLFKIWLEQRQLSHGFGSFEGAMSAFLLAYLLHTKKINKQMNSYQVFRIVLVALTENDFLSSQCCSLTNEKIIENLFIQDDCVLIDQSGLLNVFHTLTRANYKRLKHEARISLNSFNDPVIDHFQTLFITSMEPIYSMDAIIQISSVDQYEKLLDEKSNKNQLLMDNLNNKHYLLCRDILNLLENALKERINLLCPLPSFRQIIKSVIKFHEISNIYQKQFHSSTIHKHNQEYIEYLNEKLQQWKIKTIEQIDNILKQKIDEIKQFYNEYYKEINKQYSTINEQIEKKNFSFDINDQIEYLYIYSQLNSIEKRIRLNTNLFKINQFNEIIKLEYAHYRELTIETTILPLKQMFKDKSQFIQNRQLSLKRQSIENTIHQNKSNKEWILKPIGTSSIEFPFSLKDQHIKSKTLKHESTIPILIEKNRELYNSREKITEYTIESLLLSQIKQQQLQSSNDDKQTLFHSYKILISDENNYQNSLKQNNQFDTNSKLLLFNLKNFNQINYSILMFTQCETKYNCIASSTKRNEFILYNSKLNILITLQYEENRNNCHRLYLQWPSTLSSNISDITYCDTNDQYLISTNDNNHLYIFNTNLLSVNDLGCLSDNLPLNYIHCYHHTIYCILGNHKLVEYHLDTHNLKLIIKQNIELFNSNDILLDITCDKNNLVVIYKNQNNEIYLRSINRKTLDIQLEFLLDNKQEIEGHSLRIESTKYNENFIYINSLQKCLKTIDLTHSKDRKITSIMQRNKSPTNICLLKDARLWPINESVPTRTTITLGVIFSDQYDLSVLKGPENGSKEAQAFRKLWSERCELRRYPDGSILESVVWNVDCAKDKRLIWMDATRYLLEIQAGISPTNIEFLYNDQCPSTLLSIPTRLFPSYGTGDEQQIYLCRELIELSKQIRTLNNELPLKINNIIGIDEIFRYTNVFPPLPSLFQTDLHKIRSIEHDEYALIPRLTSRYAPPYSQSLLILCQLEMTSSNDEGFETVERIKHSKILYYIQLSKLLKENFHYICHPTTDCCYIEKNYYIYRLIISYHKEIYLIESQAGKKDGLERIIKQTNLSKNLRYNTEYLPKINAAIYGISQQFVHYQLVSRLFKRWLSSQLLLYHFDPINADLLCCYIFLHSAPFVPPKSMLTGFCRILRLLRDYDWINEPLIINFNHELTKEQIFEMQTQFKIERSNLPALCLMSSVAFHDNQKPNVPILKRVIQLAKEALAYLETNNSDSMKFLFRPSLNSYDVIIMLNPLQCPRAYQAVDHVISEITYTTRKKLIDNDQTINDNKKCLSIVDYDPAQLFVNELRTSYNDQAEFFHDEFGGLIVGVLWKPSSHNHSNIDYVKIIDQWKLLGTGIIKEIRTFPERWC